MKTDRARRALEAARAEADRIGKPVSVAIVDAAGLLVLFERLNDARAFTAYVAEGKACASAFTGRDSGDLQGMMENYPAFGPALAAKLAGRFVPVRGAVVLTDPSGVVGAIGVSGATAEEDERIAKAGAAALGGG